MRKYIIRSLAFIGTLIFFTVAGLSAGNQDIMVSSLCCIVGTTFLVISCGKRVTWIHRSINYGYALCMILINFFSGNFSFIDAACFLFVSQLWYWDFKEVRERCKQLSS